MAIKPRVALGARFSGLDALTKLALRLNDDGFRPTVESEVAKRLGKTACKKAAISIREPGASPKAAMAIALGGDGSFIQVASRYAVRGIPMVGINLGRVGFLADINHKAMADTVKEMLAGHYRDELRIILEVKHYRKKRLVLSRVVINDVVIDRGDVGTLIDLDVSIDKEQAFQLRGDGVIVSTPGGSTAYNIAAGGPIVTPDCSCMILNPLNPYSLTHRPIVFNSSRRFTFRIVGKSRLVLDGQKMCGLEPKDIIEVKNHGKQMIVRHPIGYDYFGTLREKLYWRQS